MYLQGSLQKVFDALYEAGFIEPMLKMDWDQLQKEKAKNSLVQSSLISQVNETAEGDLVSLIRQMPDAYAYSIALEVAYEFAQFAEEKVLH